MNYGLQLWSVRDSLKVDFENTIKELNKMGYSSVEPFAFWDHSAEQVVEWFNKYNITLSGTHTGIQQLDDDIDAVIKYHKTLGNKRIIIPHIDTSTKAALDIAVEKFNRYAPILAENGISLQYHNHNREFIPNEDGIIPNYYFFEKTDIKFEIDTFWVYVAGRDPLDVLEEFKTRVECIHLKDGLLPENGERAPGRALGEGTAPVKEVIAKGKELGFEMIVESEGLDPTGLEEVSRCMEFLKVNG